MLPLVWVTDPWHSLDHSADTTLRLFRECLQLNIPTRWSSSDFILNTQCLTSVNVCAWDGKSGMPSEPFEVQTSKIHRLLYRPDPPVDLSYLSLLSQLEERLGSSRILNPPSVLKQSEKLLPPSLSHLAPLGWVVSDTQSSEKCWNESSTLREFVLKPMNSAQSKGVEILKSPSNQQEWGSLMFEKTKQWTEPVMIQEFLPQIHEGEIRLWFVFGRFLAALKKFPISGDFRVQIDQGSRIEPFHPTSELLPLISQIGLALSNQGVALAAIDLIGSKISDYNITSPGLLVQLEQVHQKNFSRIIIEEILLKTRG